MPLYNTPSKSEVRCLSGAHAGSWPCGVENFFAKAPALEPASGGSLEAPAATRPRAVEMQALTLTARLATQGG